MKNTMTSVHVIEDRALALVTGGGEAEGATDPSDNSLMARGQRWIESKDWVNYGVGAGTGFVFGPVVAHAIEKPWQGLKWVARHIRR